LICSCVFEARLWVFGCTSVLYDPSPAAVGIADVRKNVI
jgi:hypothetical protein